MQAYTRNLQNQRGRCGGVGGGGRNHWSMVKQREILQVRNPRTKSQPKRVGIKLEIKHCSGSKPARYVENRVYLAAVPQPGAGVRQAVHSPNTLLVLGVCVCVSKMFSYVQASPNNKKNKQKTLTVQLRKVNLYLSTWYTVYYRDFFVSLQIKISLT